MERDLKSVMYTFNQTGNSHEDKHSDYNINIASPPYM